VFDSDSVTSQAEQGCLQWRIAAPGDSGAGSKLVTVSGKKEMVVVCWRYIQLKSRLL